MDEDINATLRGTPIAKSWPKQWVKTVSDAESRLGKRICGARTQSGTPCELASKHSSGRCRFHGGFDLTGAPEGNRNAMLHGLYSRRLQICGDHCPVWKSCPCAGPDVMNQAPEKRPTCPYEQIEYNAVVADTMARADVTAYPDPRVKHMVHTVALLQTMMSRAVTALRSTTLIDEVRVKSEKYAMSTDKLNPSLVAFTRIANEYRRFHAILETMLPKPPAGMGRAMSYEDPKAVELTVHQDEHHDDAVSLDPHTQALSQRPDTPREDHAEKLLKKASKPYMLHEPNEILNTLFQAERLSEAQVDKGLDDILQALHHANDRYSVPELKQRYEQIREEKKPP